MVIVMELQKRKHPRLKEYDYSQNGCYFVTICVKEREMLLGKVLEEQGQIQLSNIGKIAEKFILNINAVYSTVSVDIYSIMPNHIHLLICIDNTDKKIISPTLHTIIRSLKTMVTKQIKKTIWQTSYYEHIVRTENEYVNIWKYIEENIYKWKEDELYLW